jgi:hypothetical protein
VIFFKCGMVRKPVRSFLACGWRRPDRFTSRNCYFFILQS